MDQVNSFVNALNGILFHDYVVFALLFTGVLFTVWSGFGQYRALTHGVGVIRGKYDRKDDPGAINHFQALSAALSATVGLGNIAGVAVAVALGGPGAVFWMWVIGVLGMALKMTEVTQSMLYRNLDNPDEPHGGPMFVVRRGLARRGFGAVGNVVGGVFCVTLILSAITGGNNVPGVECRCRDQPVHPGDPKGHDCRGHWRDPGDHRRHRHHRRHQENRGGCRTARTAHVCSVLVGGCLCPDPEHW